MSATIQNTLGRMRRSWRTVLIVAAGAGLLVLASHLDPNHDAQVARDKEAEAERAPDRLRLDFGQLSFTPAAAVLDAQKGQTHHLDLAPPAIKAYDGRRVSICGYMIPMRMEGERVREFLIMPNQMSCCYGMPPRFCEFIAAKKSGAPAPNLMDTPLTFEGVLKVGDVYEGTYWTQFYTLECTGVMK